MKKEELKFNSSDDLASFLDERVNDFFGNKFNGDTTGVFGLGLLAGLFIARGTIDDTELNDYMLKTMEQINLYTSIAISKEHIQ